MSAKQRKNATGSCPVCGAPSSRGPCQRHRAGGRQSEHSDKYATYKEAYVPVATLTLCPSRSPKGWGCSLPTGHDGDHFVARGRKRTWWPA